MKNKVMLFEEFVGSLNEKRSKDWDDYDDNEIANDFMKDSNTNKNSDGSDLAWFMADISNEHSIEKSPDSWFVDSIIDILNAKGYKKINLKDFIKTWNGDIGGYMSEDTYESFIFESLEDNIYTLSETKNTVEAKLKKYKITNYTISEDLTVDVKGNVYLSSKNLEKLPFIFGKVTGNFDCSENKLTTLKGAPLSVGGNFDCSYNKLTTLEGAPLSVGIDFLCNRNNINTIKDAPKSVGRNFYCDVNNIVSLEGAPDSVKGIFDCSNNKIKSLIGSPKSVGMDFNCTFNNIIDLNGAPTKVGRDFLCGGNKTITSLKGAPEYISGNFKCVQSNITSLEGAPKRVEGDFSTTFSNLVTLKGAPEYVGGKFRVSNTKSKFTEDDVKSISDVRGEIIV